MVSRSRSTTVVQVVVCAPRLSLGETLSVVIQRLIETCAVLIEDKRGRYPWHCPSLSAFTSAFANAKGVDRKPRCPPGKSTTVRRTLLANTRFGWEVSPHGR